MNVIRDTPGHIESADFERIFLDYYLTLCNYASGILHSDTDAEDVVEGLFVRLWERQESFQSEHHLKAWLYRSTRNACLDFLKVTGRSQERHRIYMENIQKDEAGILRDIIRHEVVRELYIALRALPPQAAKVIRMSYLEGLSNQEIADALGVSIHTIKNQKARGLALLRKAMPDGRPAILAAGTLCYFIDLLTRH